MASSSSLDGCQKRGGHSTTMSPSSSMLIQPAVGCCLGRGRRSRSSSALLETFQHPLSLQSSATLIAVKTDRCHREREMRLRQLAFQSCSKIRYSQLNTHTCYSALSIKRTKWSSSRHMQTLFDVLLIDLEVKSQCNTPNNALERSLFDNSVSVNIVQ